MYKYEPLSVFLMHLDTKYKEFTFSEIEKIISAKLAPSAYKHREWWSNNDDTHTQSKYGWSCVGWYVEHVNFDRQIVIFLKR